MARYHNKFCLHLIITSMKSSACIGGTQLCKQKKGLQKIEEELQLCLKTENNVELSSWIFSDSLTSLFLHLSFSLLLVILCKSKNIKYKRGW